MINKIKTDATLTSMTIFDHKSTQFIELIIFFEVLWDLSTLMHDTNCRKPKSHAWIGENPLIMAQKRCQISSWSHGHPQTSPKTCFSPLYHCRAWAKQNPNLFITLGMFVPEWVEWTTKNEKWTLSFDIDFSCEQRSYHNQCSPKLLKRSNKR